MLTALIFENDKSVTTEIQNKCLLGEGNQPAVLSSFSLALTMIEYENENPATRTLYERECTRRAA